MRRYQWGVYLLGFGWLVLGLWACPLDLKHSCQKHSDCVEGYVCDLVKEDCVPCIDCRTCTSREECDDNNICTDDTCPASGICKNEFNTIPCGDGVFCNGEDVCDGKGNCFHPGDPCKELGCDTQMDACVCNQHSDCVEGYLCDLDQRLCVSCPDCRGCMEQEECDDNNVCTDEICPASGICQYGYNTVPCDDGLKCNGEDVCDGEGNCSNPGEPCEDWVWKSIAAGGEHTCGLTNPGTAYCWGSDLSGQLGDGGEANNPQSPVAVKGGIVFKQLSAGVSHTCGITDDGTAYCWGADYYGQLGDGGEAQDSQSPVPVEGDMHFVQIAAGGRHTCGITTEGKPYCWGLDMYGQLGDGGVDEDSQIPVPVEGDMHFVQIAAGGYHTCGITADSEAYCWGADYFGQLGNGGESQDSQIPVAVDTASLYHQ